MFVVTLDALGTLYTFRDPLSTQYLKIARQCGLRAEVDPQVLTQSFKFSFKHYNAAYPNYGKGVLHDPEVWWTKVVNRAFSEVIEGEEIPPDLGSALYRHFSSGAAYVPFSDVKPFLQSMAALKKRFSDPEGPLVATGVITNSDPRVRLVLQDMGFRVGPSRVPEVTDDRAVRQEALQKGDMSTFFASPWKEYFNPTNDFDFLCTSYESDAEKPNPAIFGEAEKLLIPMTVSRAEQSSETPSGFGKGMSNIFEGMRHRPDRNKTMWVHIGDDYSKDYVGAIDSGLNALYLRRGNDSSAPPEAKDAAETVESLDQAAMVVNVMAGEFLGDHGGGET